MKKKNIKKNEKEYIVYCIHNNYKYTYIGITNNFTRRIRQHNGEITGGAKYTRRYRPWKVLFTIHGLTCKKEVLQLEWAIKHRRRKGYSGVKGRIRTLEYLLSLPVSWTKKAPPICTMNITICLHDLTKKQYLEYAGIKDLKFKFGKGRNISYKY